MLNKAGLSPWHVAAAAGAAAIIGELAAAPGAAGLEAAATSGDKHTPLLAALLTGKHAAVAALVQAGAKLSTPDASTGATPLMRLLAAGKVGDAQRLLELGDCNVNAQVRGACSPRVHRGACFQGSACGPRITSGGVCGRRARRTLSRA